MEEKGFKIRNFFRSFYGVRNILGVFSSRLNSSFDFSLFRVKKGFTLIEVLVVIAIIAILSTAAMMLINPSLQLQKSRDGRRKSDIKLIQAALELYRSDNGAYPDSTSNAVTNCTPSFTSKSGGSCNSTDTVYMQNVPKDPKTGLDYYYCGPNDSCPGESSGGYFIYSCLENTSDTSKLVDANSSPPLPASGITGTMQCPTGSVYYGVTNP